jgi:hypothetical protein
MTTPTAPGGATTAAAAALIRATLIDDRAAGMLIIDQNGGARAGAAGEELVRLVIDLAVLAEVILLKANGYDVGKALKAIEGFMEQSARRTG